MPKVRSSDGAQIYFEALGEGPPLILCNASFSTHAHWTGQTEALARRFRVVTWDYRGHGLSDAPREPERYSLAQIVEDLRAVHSAAAADVPAFVSGLSVGGLVTMSYALAHPTLARALLLFNTGPGFKNPEARASWEAMLERAASKMEEIGLAGYLEGRSARAQLLGLDQESKLARLAREGILTSSVAGLTLFARQVAGPVPNLMHRLAEIHQPCLVLAGEHDAGFKRASEVLASKLPRARRVVLKGAGHVLNLDQSESFVRAVEDFVAGLDGF
jgi:pimeloyl-ACP methyl ester carboxylesterase